MPLTGGGLVTVGGERVHVSDCEITLLDGTGAPKDDIFAFTASPATGHVDLH